MNSSLFRSKKTSSKEFHRELKLERAEEEGGRGKERRDESANARG